MYADHATKIQAYTMENADNLAHMIIMVSASIQQPWYKIGGYTQDIVENGLKSRHLWGYKASTYKDLMARKEDIYSTLQDYKAGRISQEHCLLDIAAIPGLGLVKAGFVTQMSVGFGGCLDRHNLRRFGLKKETFELGKVKPETALGKARLYLTVCKELGGCEYLWNSWCEYLASLYPTRYQNGNHVSALHSIFLGLEEYPILWQ